MQAGPRAHTFERFHLGIEVGRRLPIQVADGGIQQLSAAPSALDVDDFVSRPIKADAPTPFVHADGDNTPDAIGEVRLVLTNQAPFSNWYFLVVEVNGPAAGHENNPFEGRLKARTSGGKFATSGV